MSVLITFIKLIAVFDLLVIAVYFGGDILSTMSVSYTHLDVYKRQGKEWGGMGQNYLRSLLALGFQAFLILSLIHI